MLLRFKKPTFPTVYAKGRLSVRFFVINGEVEFVSTILILFSACSSHKIKETEKTINEFLNAAFFSWTLFIELMLRLQCGNPDPKHSNVQTSLRSSG